MAEREDLLTALEACRPRSADLEFPELSELQAALCDDPALARQFMAVQRWDEAAREAVLAGDVPAGLENRILAALQTAENPPEEPPDGQQDQPAREPTRSRRILRRRVWLSLATAAAVAVLATGVTMWPWLAGSEPLTASILHEQAAQWCDKLAATDWRGSAAPRDFPFPREVRYDPDAWQRVSIPGGGEAVAYRLPPPAPSIRRMTLLVLKAEVTGLGPFPPASPFKTMDRLVAAWQIGGNVYVLVIQGDDLGVLQEVYQRHVNTQVHAA